jgi:hypothetical protein
MPMLISPKILLAMLLWGAGAAALAEDGARNQLSQFSELQSLEESEWEPLEFPNIDAHSAYELVQEGGQTVVRAETDGGASGLILRRRIDPIETPIIEWRWKVSNVFEKGNARQKSGDDYPARIYVAFAFEPDQASFFERAKRSAAGVFYDEEIPGTALNYIWANQVEQGEIVTNPFSEETQMVAVTSGAEQVGEWVSVRRNVVEDYQAAFGRKPPAIIGIGIMSDSDNTGESATAWYGDIELKAAE